MARDIVREVEEIIKEFPEFADKTMQEQKVDLVAKDVRRRKLRAKFKLLLRDIEKDLEAMTISEVEGNLAEYGQRTDQSSKSLCAIFRRHIEQKKQAELRKQKQARYKFEQRYRQLYTLDDIPDGEWFGTDKNGAPLSNSKNVALALKRLPMLRIVQGTIIYNNYAINLHNAPVFFKHVLHERYRFLPKLEHIEKALKIILE
jgi:hypothetical protein